jgi:hypothetical protein
MSNTFFGIAVDCPDAAAVADFWAAALGRQVAQHPNREHAVIASAHRPPRTTFGDIEGNEFDLISG